MTEPTGPMLNYSAAAAKLAAALWLTHIAIIVLRRGKPVAVWQIALSIATVVFSTVVWRSESSSGWFVASILALVMLIDGLRQWMSLPLATENDKHAASRWPVLTLTLAATGFALCTYASALSSSVAMLGGQPHPLTVLGLLSLFTLFAILLASTLELTVGALGEQLWALPWQRLANVATFAFLAEILQAGWIVAHLKPSETIEMSAAPVMVEFSRLLLAYIAWCVPRRMALLASQKELKGQASLALAGWIGLICFAIAMALPAAWM